MTTEPPPQPTPGPDGRSSGRRKILADWVANPTNPLTARVMVNRIWHQHFGRGLVRSANDFGYRGTPSTHPELLDWLASEFSDGWSLKAMHRLIVTSATYQQASTPPTPALPHKGGGGYLAPSPLVGEGRGGGAQSDLENNLFWRFDLRRLAAEEVRDSVLAVCGNLNRTKMGGPSIYPRIQREVLYGQSMPGVGWGQSPPEEQSRRSVYVHIKRSLSVPFLTVFDAADTDSSCPVRFTTTQPTQALGMLNGDFANDQAKIFAADVRRTAGDDPAAQVRLALRRVTQREPSVREVERGLDLMARLREKHQLGPEEALRGFCLLALNLNEFIYLE